MACKHCGRENEADARFCIDCGKSLQTTGAGAASALMLTRAGPPRPQATSQSPVQSKPSASGVATAPAPSQGVCTRCGRTVDASLPFCAHCGNRVTASVVEGACPTCSAPFQLGVDMYCARCGARVGERVTVL
ncbi:MAG: double zinc ribbon domain-containing protein, partial [Gemmatimonadaceae bacterium]